MLNMFLIKLEIIKSERDECDLFFGMANFVITFTIYREVGKFVPIAK